MTPPPLVGGRFVLTNRLSQGLEMATFLAFDLRGRVWRSVWMLRGTAATRQNRQRFARGVDALSTTRHPNLVGVIQADVDATSPWVALEFSEGGSLAEYLERHGPVHPLLAVTAIRGACAGVEALDGRGVVPAALSPASLLLDQGGTCTLADLTGARFDPHPDDRQKAARLLGEALHALITGSTADLASMDAEDPSFAGLSRPLVEVILKSRWGREDSYASAGDLADALEDLDLPRVPRATPPLGGRVVEVPAAPPEVVPSLRERGLEAFEDSPRWGRRPASIPPMPAAPQDEPAPPPPPAPKSIATPVPQAAARALDIRASHRSTAGPAPRSTAQGGPLASRVRGGLLVLLMLSAPLSIGAAATWIAASEGARALLRAERSTQHGEERLIVLLEHHGPMVRELVEMGVDDAAVLAAVHAFQDASPDQRGAAALVLSDTLQTAWAERERREAPPGISHAIADLSDARAVHRAALQRWRTVSEAMPGRLAIALGKGAAAPPAADQ